MAALSTVPSDGPNIDRHTVGRYTVEMMINPLPLLSPSSGHLDAYGPHLREGGGRHGRALIIWRALCSNQVGTYVPQ